jgi:gas vesicle protein
VRFVTLMVRRFSDHIFNPHHRAARAGGSMFGRDTHDEHDSEHERGDRLDPRALGVGVLIGLALGAGAALLLAPASGADTRRQLRRGARRLYDRSADAVEELKDETTRSARRLARRGMKRGRALVDGARDTVRDTVRNGGRW